MIGLHRYDTLQDNGILFLTYEKCVRCGKIDPGY